MKKLLTPILILLTGMVYCQTNPAITKWLFNTTGIMGRHYVTGNPVPISDATLANVQQVRYSSTDAYINATGIPSYITGPYALGISSLALDNNYVFKIPLNPSVSSTVNIGDLDISGNLLICSGGTTLLTAVNGSRYTQWWQEDESGLGILRGTGQTFNAKVGDYYVCDPLDIDGCTKKEHVSIEIRSISTRFYLSHLTLLNITAIIPP